jgi:hypothetical protein
MFMWAALRGGPSHGTGSVPLVGTGRYAADAASAAPGPAFAAASSSSSSAAAHDRKGGVIDEKHSAASSVADRSAAASASASAAVVRPAATMSHGGKAGSSSAGSGGSAADVHDRVEKAVLLHLADAKNGGTIADSEAFAGDLKVDHSVLEGVLRSLASSNYVELGGGKDGKGVTHTGASVCPSGSGTLCVL